MCASAPGTTHPPLAFSILSLFLAFSLPSSFHLHLLFSSTPFYLLLFPSFLPFLPLLLLYPFLSLPNYATLHDDFGRKHRVEWSLEPLESPKGVSKETTIHRRRWPRCESRAIVPCENDRLRQFAYRSVVPTDLFGNIDAPRNWFRFGIHPPSL